MFVQHNDHLQYHSLKPWANFGPNILSWAFKKDWLLSSSLPHMNFFLFKSILMFYSSLQTVGSASPSIPNGTWSRYWRCWLEGILGSKSSISTAPLLQFFFSLSDQWLIFSLKLILHRYYKLPGQFSVWSSFFLYAGSPYPLISMVWQVFLASMILMRIWVTLNSSKIFQ